MSMLEERIKRSGKFSESTTPSAVPSLEQLPPEAPAQKPAKEAPVQSNNSQTRPATAANKCVPLNPVWPFTTAEEATFLLSMSLGTNQGRRQRGGSGARPPHLKSVLPISCLVPWLLHTPNIVIKNGPPCVCPPCYEILATGLGQTRAFQYCHSNIQRRSNTPKNAFWKPKTAGNAALHSARS